MDDRDDLGELWGAAEQDAFSEAQRRHSESIAANSASTGGGGGGGRRATHATVTVSTAPFVPLHRIYEQRYTEYVRDKLAECDDDSGDEEEPVPRQRQHRRDDSVDEAEYEEATQSPDDDDNNSDASDDASPLKRKRSHNHAHEPERHKRQRQADDLPQVQHRRPECFLCAWGDKFHDGIEAPHANKLTEIIKRNYGVHDNTEIAQELHLYFKHEVYDPSRGMVMLTAAVALEHIEGLHSLDATIYIGESIRKEKRIAFMLENMIFREDGTYDKAALADFRRSQKEIRDLYLMPVSRMNFSNGNTKDDMRGASNYFNLQQPFSQRQSDRARQQQLARTRNQPTFRLT